MTKIDFYLTFTGNCAEAFDFYKSVFGGEFSFVGRYKDMPPNPDMPVADVDKDKIMHISLPIGNGAVLMGSDVSAEYEKTIVSGNNFSISVTADTNDDVTRIYNELSADGKIIMPLAKTFWSPLFGLIVDKFGIQWMVSTEPEEEK